MKSIAVLLAGSGVYDGSEIHEAVFSLLEISNAGYIYQCFAPDKEQYHVINHVTGEEMPESRNVLTESARIARGEVNALSEINPENFVGLVIPGGFGAAKNLNQWAIAGPDGQIDSEVKNVIEHFATAGIPILGLCMGPTVIAQALKNTNKNVRLTVGDNKTSSPYDIEGISAGIESMGASIEYKTKFEVCVDEQQKIVTAPCYMMDATITEVHQNVKMAVAELVKLIER